MTVNACILTFFDFHVALLFLRLQQHGLGYVVISKKADAYDGLVKIKQGTERGYEKGKEPKK